MVGAMVDRMGREVAAAIGGMRTGLGERLEGLGSPGAVVGSRQARKQAGTQSKQGSVRQGPTGPCGLVRLSCG